MKGIKPWHAVVLLLAFGIPFLLQVSLYPLVAFQMFSQPSAVDKTEIKLLGLNLFWQPIVPEASFGSTGEWTVFLKNKSKANQQQLLEVFANTQQGKRYQSLKLISISQLGDTTILAQCFQK